MAWWPSRSIRPILAVLIMGMCLSNTEISYTPFTVPTVFYSQEVGLQFLEGFPVYLKEVLLGLLPVIVFFGIFQVISLRLKKESLIRLMIGLLYTYVGLVLFLTGVNVGFMPAGNYLGSAIAELDYNWILIPIGMVVGYFIVAAEPAVHVLNKQVEEITGGAVPQKAIQLSLSIGVAVSVGIAMLPCSHRDIHPVVFDSRLCRCVGAYPQSSKDFSRRSPLTPAA